MLVLNGSMIKPEEEKNEIENLDINANKKHLHI